LLDKLSPDPDAFDDRLPMRISTDYPGPFVRSFGPYGVGFALARRIRMSTELEFDDLIRRWQEALGRGEEPSTEELCRDCPEMAEVLDRELAARELARLGVSDIVGADSPPDRFSSGALAVGAEPVPGYRLVVRISEGVSAEVWKAIGPGGFPVAMKFVRVAEDLASSTAARRRRRANLRSLELIREVRHANLLPVFGDWHRDGLLIFVAAVGPGSPSVPGHFRPRSSPAAECESWRNRSEKRRHQSGWRRHRSPASNAGEGRGGECPRRRRRHRRAGDSPLEEVEESRRDFLCGRLPHDLAK
jgi:hypothetical protein